MEFVIPPHLIIGTTNGNAVDLAGECGPQVPDDFVGKCHDAGQKFLLPDEFLEEAELICALTSHRLTGQCQKHPPTVEARSWWPYP